eukprot:g19268.t1
MASPASLMSRGSTRSSGYHVDTLDRKAVNPPRFREFKTETKPGPGAHDPRLDFTRDALKFSTFSFSHDDRSRYLGRAGMKPLSVVKRAQQQQAENSDFDDTTMTPGSSARNPLSDFGAEDEAAPPPGTYSPKNNLFQKQSLANEFCFGKQALGGLFPGVPRDVLGVSSGRLKQGSADNLMSALSASLMRSADESGKQTTIAPGTNPPLPTVTTGLGRSETATEAVAPGGSPKAKSRSSSAGAQVQVQQNKDKQAAGETTGSRPGTQGSNASAGSGHFFNGPYPQPSSRVSTAQHEKFSGVCKPAGTAIKCASLSPRLLQKEATLKQTMMDKEAAEAARVDWFDNEIKKGPLNLELHRYLVFLQSNPTFKSHRAVAQKEQMARMMARKNGEKSNQTDCLGSYQYKWPAFEPERS